MHLKLMFLSMACFCLLVQGQNAQFEIEIFDPPGSGFNDETPAAPVGGNGGTTVGALRTNVLVQALDILGFQMYSDQVIKVRVLFSNLQCGQFGGVLAGGRAASIFTNFDHFPLRNTWYPAALADKLEQLDLEPDRADMFVIVNARVGNDGCLGGAQWYYGFDHNQGNGIDLLIALLHEISHGLGFANFTDEVSGAFTAGVPSIYDHFTFDVQSGKFWTEMSDAERVASAINGPNVVWNGTNVTRAVPRFLDPEKKVTVQSPPLFAGDFAAKAAAFSGPLPSGGLSALVAEFHDGVGQSEDGCQPAQNGAALLGKIVLIDRGGCPFTNKALAAQQAGAAAVLIVNDESGVPFVGGYEPQVQIPVFGVDLEFGQYLRNAMGDNEVTLFLSENPYQEMGTTNGMLRLFAPNPLLPGSSISHWDQDASPNLLMEPSINEDLGDMGDELDLTLEVFKDMGWFICREFEMTAVAGQEIKVYGSPGCVFDLWETHGSDNPADWDLVGESMQVGPYGFSNTGLFAQTDSGYQATVPGEVDEPLVGYMVYTVPALSPWGVALFLSTMLTAALFLRRRSASHG